MLKNQKHSLSFILTAAFRNLIRQKRRNLLLAFAMSFGMMILILASSFSAGITDLILNNFIALTSGHISITVREQTDLKGDLIRGKDRFEKIVKENIPELKEFREGLSVWGRVIGNGRSDAMVIIGMDKTTIEKESAGLRFVEGSLKDFINTPDSAILYKSKADKLKLKLGDELNARFLTVDGQTQAVKYRLVAILESAGMFQDMTVMVSMVELAAQVDLQKQDARQIQILLEKPMKAKYYADLLHKKLAPKPALIEARLGGDSFLIAAPDSLAVSPFLSNFVIEGTLLVREKGRVLLPQTLKSKYKIGEVVVAEYESLYNGPIKMRMVVDGFFSAQESNGAISRLMIVSPQTQYLTYYKNLPKERTGGESTELTELKRYLSESPTLSSNIAKNWILLRRSPTTADIQVKYSELSKKPWKGSALDIRTMYETGEQMMQMESAMNGLTAIAVIVMLAISMIGVLNTLRMTIRERRGEIGTLRSIGMQKGEIRFLFTSEFIMLALFAAISGIVGSVVIATLLSLPEIEADKMSFLLNDKHLYFVLKPASLAIYGFILVAVVGVFSWLSAKAASELRPADVLRKVD